MSLKKEQWLIFLTKLNISQAFKCQLVHFILPGKYQILISTLIH